MYWFYALLGLLYPASCFISNTRSHFPEMSIVRQNSGTEPPAAFLGWPDTEDAAMGGTRPSAPANTLCSLLRKWLSGKGLPANKMDLNQ